MAVLHLLLRILLIPIPKIVSPVSANFFDNIIQICSWEDSSIFSGEGLSVLLSFRWLCRAIPERRLDQERQCGIYLIHPIVRLAVRFDGLPAWGGFLLG